MPWLELDEELDKGRVMICDHKLSPKIKIVSPGHLPDVNVVQCLMF